MRHDADRALGLGTAWTLFVICCVLPIAWMLGQAGGRELASALTGVFAAERQRVLLAHTTIIGVGAAAGACCIGVPLGTALGRSNPARVRLTRLALVAPLVFPSYVIALAWVSIAERWVPQWTYGLPAAVANLAFMFYPVVMLATEVAVRRLPSHLEEAARLVASNANVWLKVVFPLTRPVIAASALVVFVLAVSDFAVPSMLRVRVYTTEVFTAFSALYDFRLATLTSLPLAVIGGAAAIAAVALSRASFVARAPRGPTGVPWSRRAANPAAVLLMIAGAVVFAGPIVTVAMTARHGRSLFTDAASTEAVLNGVAWSFAGATGVAAIGMLLGQWRVEASARSAYLAEILWIALFALPATVAGIGVIGMWNRQGIPGAIYRTDAIVVIAYVARFVPVAALLCAAVLGRMPRAAHEAAIVSGASWARAWSRVAFPMARRGFAAVWLVMFILMLGEVSLTILVAPPGESNLAVRAYTLMANSPISDVARIALVQVGLSVLPLVLIGLAARERGTD